MAMATSLFAVITSTFYLLDNSMFLTNDINGTLVTSVAIMNGCGRGRSVNWSIKPKGYRYECQEKGDTNGHILAENFHYPKYFINCWKQPRAQNEAQGIIERDVDCRDQKVMVGRVNSTIVYTIFDNMGRFNVSAIYTDGTIKNLHTGANSEVLTMLYDFSKEYLGRAFRFLKQKL